ncbi:Uu.00g082270.m01.CDS01 [Anthostomella pinea]|uniref:Uu.00g082270.m01.CDS01 n=1 Tax=Anthostomella pinea TaxID=933095 RepID=A0AAI8VLB3_9PEZI|nr:Uu.00g082270.m01.CDS01 [Anthostomella pinea]
MRFSTTAKISILALANTAACEESWVGGLAGRASAIVGKPKQTRQLDFGGSEITIGGIDLGESDRSLTESSTDGTALTDSTGLSLSNPLQDAAGQAEVARPAADEAGAGSLIELLALLGGGAAAEDEAAAGDAPAEEEAAAEDAAAGEAAANDAAEEGTATEDIAAVEEAEDFDGNLGIILDGEANAINLGGDLGVTQGSDGSQSVGGEAGINIVA